MLTALMLTLLAIVLVGSEAFIPSLGILGVCGIAAFGYALWLGFHESVFFGGVLLVGGIAGAAGGYWFAFTRLMPKMGLIPGDPPPVVHEEVPAAVLPEVGSVGMTESVLRPGGTVRFGDLRAEAFAEGVVIPAGARVRVSRVVGIKVIVERLPE